MITSFGALASQLGSDKSDNEIGTLKTNVSVLTTNLSIATNQLAKVRIKPFKERLIDWLKELAGSDAQQMLDALRSGRAVEFKRKTLDAVRLHQMEEFSNNPETKDFISIKRGVGGSVILLGQPASEQVDLTVSPLLLK